ncbi:hypothetical protein TYRP_020365 [Tyrophagus putrescentiae]|nr:hypothetical protein TYRP_020365 [Tyrophagus putrescentiae]
MDSCAVVSSGLSGFPTKRGGVGGRLASRDRPIGQAASTFGSPDQPPPRVLVGDLVNEGRKILLNNTKSRSFVPHYAEEGAVVGGADVRPLEPCTGPNLLRTLLLGQLNAVFVSDLVNEGRKVLLNLAKGGRLSAGHSEEGTLIRGANVRPLELCTGPNLLRAFLLRQLNVDEAQRNWPETQRNEVFHHLLDLLQRPPLFSHANNGIFS